MGTLWGKGKLGIGRDGVGEEESRCHVRPSSFWCCLRTDSIPWKAPSKTKAGATRQAAQGPIKKSLQPNQGCGRSPMYFGSPGLALILVVSAAPWSRNIDTRPPGPKAGSRTLLGAPPLSYPPHQS